MVSDRLKKFIFDKLYKELSHLEIIPYENSLFFIDRKEKYWYLEYKKNGALYWRWQFFPKYFNLFSLEEDEFEPIISEWVEEVLNCKVVIPEFHEALNTAAFEEVLNCKVVTPTTQIYSVQHLVEKVLNCKVDRTIIGFMVLEGLLEEVLNSK